MPRMARNSPRRAADPGEQVVVHVVVQYIAIGATSRDRVIIQQLDLEAELSKECRQPIGTAIRARKQKQDFV